MNGKKKKKTNGKKIFKASKQAGKLELIPNRITLLEQAMGGDKDLVLFFLCWLKHDRNATKAYRELHPNVDDQVASVLGARRLAKVRELGGVEMLLEAYGVGIDKYFYQLKEGLEATIKKEVQSGMDDFGPVFSTIEEPDHRTRRHYHQALGKMIGVEGMDIQINNTNQNLNNNQNSIDNLNDDELDDLVS